MQSTAQFLAEEITIKAARHTSEPSVESIKANQNPQDSKKQENSKKPQSESSSETPGQSQAGGGITRAAIQDLLARAQNEHSLDFLVVADSTGRVVARNNDSPYAGETILQGPLRNPVAEKVINEAGSNPASALSGLVVEQGETLSRYFLDKTAGVTRSDGSVLSKGLLIEACAPVFSSGRFAGVVLIGQMLNKYYVARPGESPLKSPLVAEIRQNLTSGTDVKSEGALIALGDTIIASSLTEDGSSEPLLIGARHNPAASMETIYSEGASYETAWRPESSIDGLEAGYLGIAIPAREMASPQSLRRKLIIGLCLGAFVTGGLAGFLYGRAISARLSLLAESVGRMTVGELSTPVRDRLKYSLPKTESQRQEGGDAQPGDNPGQFVFSKDEIGKLASHLDEMRDSFRQAIERLRKR